MNELYKKVYIKTEKDLPKKTDKYIVHWKKDSDFDKINTVSWFTYEYLKESPECSVDNDYWLDYIDWYLQPNGGKSAMKDKTYEIDMNKITPVDGGLIVSADSAPSTFDDYMKLDKETLVKMLMECQGIIFTTKKGRYGKLLNPPTADDFQGDAKIWLV